MTPVICRHFLKIKTVSRTTRTSDNSLLNIPKCKLNYTQNSIFYKRVKSFNLLSVELRLKVKLKLFKTELFSHCLNFES